MRSWLAAAPVFGAATFNLVLCFLYTRGVPIREPHVVLTEFVIISAALFLGRRAIWDGLFLVMFFLFGYLCALLLLTPEPDPKIVRDLIIPFAFFALGRGVADTAAADRTVYILVLTVFAFALFEWIDLERFQRWFDIVGYYITKGSLDISDAWSIDKSNLYVSGIRTEGGEEARSLFPALGGGHRVSSIFLEPISSENFAAIAFFWITSRFTARPRVNTFFLLICTALIILADGRFAAAACAVVVLAQLVALSRRPTTILVRPIFTLALPILMLTVLVGMTYFSKTLNIDNTFLGRLYGSGSLIASFGALEWFGLQDTGFTGDSGYAYLLTKAGIVGIAIAWTTFAASPARTPQAALLRGSIALFACLSLCISASLFSIKTAALLWFLYGAAQNEAPAGRPAWSAKARMQSVFPRRNQMRSP